MKCKFVHFFFFFFLLFTLLHSTAEREKKTHTHTKIKQQQKTIPLKSLENQWGLFVLVRSKIKMQTIVHLQSIMKNKCLLIFQLYGAHPTRVHAFFSPSLIIFHSSLLILSSFLNKYFDMEYINGGKDDSIGITISSKMKKRVLKLKICTIKMGIVNASIQRAKIEPWWRNVANN